MYTRELEIIIRASIKKFQKSILLLGARQVGKSTLIKKLKPNLVINLADQSLFIKYKKEVDLLRRQVEALGGKQGLIFIDEIQRVPELLNTIQSIIDDDKSKIFILTGSSSRKLKHGSVNRLPGRLLSYSMYPLTYREIRNDFRLPDVLSKGTLPEIYSKNHGSDLLHDYVDIYLRDEIQAEAVVRHIDSFSRFLDLSAEVSGQELNYSKLSSDSEIPKETLRRYVDILEDTLLIHRLSGFANTSGSRKAVQREKLFYFDLGVRNALLKKEKDHFSESELGFLFEHWLIVELIRWNVYEKKSYELFYYRDEAKNEFDLIIETKSAVYCIEIKYSSKMKSSYFKAAEALKNSFKKPVHFLYLFRGEKKRKMAPWYGCAL